jgi:MFS transporter, DHA3 family, macrolide efflux protein
VLLVYSVAFAYPPDVRTSYAALALAFLGLSATVPALVTMFFSGAIADRHDRGHLMRTVNLLSIGATAAIAAVLVYGPTSHVPLPGPAGFYLPVWILLVYPAWALVTVSSTLFRPAFNASLPRVVETKDLGAANGIIYAVAAVASAVATLVVGFLLSWGPAVYALGIPFLLYFLTQAALVLLDADLSVTRRTAPRSVVTEARDGFVYLYRRRELLEITVAALVANFLAAVALVELGLYLEGWLGLTNGIWYGGMVAVLTAGTATGFVLAARIRFEPRAGRVLIVLTVLMGVALLAFGLVRSIWLALPIGFVYGLMPGMITTVFLSTIQATVPDEMMGRVFSADEVGSYALVPVGQFSGGLILLALGIQGMYLLAGGVMALFGVVMLASFGSLRRLGYQPQPVGEPERASAS